MYIYDKYMVSPYIYKYVTYVSMLYLQESHGFPGVPKNSSDINGDWISITRRDGKPKTHHQGMKILCDKTTKRTLW